MPRLEGADFPSTPLVVAGAMIVMIHRSRNGFTLVEVMIVVVIVGILAAIVVPFVMGYLDDAEQAAAESTFVTVQRALELYKHENNAYPESLDLLAFQANERLTLPEGYSFEYDPLTGDLALVEP